jgi:ABC-type transport system substrate-binding protein
VDRKQFFQFRGTSITALVLNTSRPLFRGNPALRMAINLALDRAAIAGAGDGWPTSIVLTDQITTRWMPGWVDHRLYPLTRPDVARARRLAAGNLRGGRAILWISPARTALARAAIIVRNLAEIGLEVQVRTLSNDVINATASVPGANYDMDFGTFPLDYPDPANVVIRLLGGENARKPAGNANYAYFDVPAYNRRMAAADRLTGEARARAFSALDRDLMRSEAPWAPLYEGSFSLFVSARVGCVDRIPFYRLDWPAVCLG